MAKVMTGAKRILAERQRQITEEGWDAEHDAEHDNDSLAWAAATYAAPTPIYSKRNGYMGGELTSTSFLDTWPSYWGSRQRVVEHKTRLRQLEIAGALCAAEIDRLLALADES